MKNYKYYTPALEDLFIGYECEQYEPANTENDYLGHYYESWDKITLDAWKIVDVAIKQKIIRTKYLDQEDIEKCGWIYREDSFHRKVVEEKGGIYTPTHYWFVMNNSNITLTWYPGQYVMIQKENPNYMLPSVKYKGECKSINELRKIMKMIGIK